MRAVALAALGGLVAACSDEAAPFVPPSFERADQAAIACIDVVAAVGVPVAECEGESASEDLHLTVLVTQSQRGELAVVDLATNRLLDVNPRVPGYTFHPVGPLPTAVAVSPDGTRAYVASTGEPRISVFDVGTIGGPEGRLDPIDIGSHVPFDLAVGDDRLFVTAPDEGLLLVVDLVSGDLTEVPLAATAGDEPDVDAGVGDGGVPDAGPDVDAGVPDAGADLDAGTSDAGATDGGTPPTAASRPWRMVLDAASGHLYVANAGRDAISVVDIATLTEVDALPIGVPTTTLAVSPERLHGDGTRWLYAVERVEGGVRVMDLDTRTLIDTNHGTYERGGETFTYGSPRLPGPAIHVPGRAQAVTLFARTSEADAAPEVLDGLFAAVLSSNGLLYVVDVEDEDHEQRATVDEPGYVYLPHRMRSLRRFTALELPRVSGNPSVAVASTQVICAANYGFIAHFATSGAPSCDDPGDGIDVHQNDPWAASDETWTVTFEGTIPGTVRTRGNLEGDHEVLDRVADFCSLGVQPGDRFVLETEPSPASESVTCGAEVAGERSWPIAEVYRDRLVLAEPFGFDPAECGLDPWIDYRVRTTDTWTVVGTQTGFAHAVVVGEDGRCVPADDADARATGRAPECNPGEECPFENATLTFSMERGTDDGRVVPSDVDLAWTFTTTGALQPLAISIGALPSSIQYLPGRDSLLAVDPVDSGLVEVSITSLSAQRSFR